MKKLVQLSLALVSILFCFNAFAAIIHDDDHNPTTFLGPTLFGSFTSPITQYSAFSLLGEAGRKNYRVGGTIGVGSELNHRLKLSAEWLRQEITYSFFTGHSDQWVNQWAVGLGYQYIFSCVCLEPALDFSAYYSHAPSKSLSTREGIIVDPLGNRFNFVNVRRIAGSNAGGAAPGISFSPWLGARAGLDLNYDYVKYDTKFSDHKAIGFGGTAHLDTALTDHLFVGASAGVRKPFNNYTAYVGWGNVPFWRGLWIFNIDGGYTKGKERLPNTWNAGLSIGYLFEPCLPPLPVSFKGDYTHEADSLAYQSYQGRDSFVNWIADPAVYMPQVLAVSEQRLTRAPIPIIVACADGIPAVVGTLPNRVFTTIVNQIPTAQVFSGRNLRFSIIANPSAGNTATINPITGVITTTQGGVQGDTFLITVIATNTCGSASTSFTVTLNADVGISYLNKSPF